MQENQENQQPQEKQPESKKFLVFYVIGLFCVALALILLSYVSQMRADRELSALNTAAAGANARVQTLQQTVEQQTKEIAEQQKLLDALCKELDADSTEQLLPRAEKINTQKQILYQMLMAQQELQAGKVEQAKARLDELVEAHGVETLNGTSKDPLLKEEVAALFTTLYNQVQAPIAPQPSVTP